MLRYCMKRREDELSFEGAWNKQLKEEEEIKQKEEEHEPQKEVKVHEEHSFRGQRDVVENRTEFRVTNKQEETVEKKHVEVLSEPSSKEGDDFDVEW